MILLNEVFLISLKVYSYFFKFVIFLMYYLKNNLNLTITFFLATMYNYKKKIINNYNTNKRYSSYFNYKTFNMFQLQVLKKKKKLHYVNFLNKKYYKKINHSYIYKKLKKIIKKKKKLKIRILHKNLIKVWGISRMVFKLNNNLNYKRIVRFKKDFNGIYNNFNQSSKTINKEFFIFQLKNTLLNNYFFNYISFVNGKINKNNIFKKSIVVQAVVNKYIFFIKFLYEKIKIIMNNKYLLYFNFKYKNLTYKVNNKIKKIIEKFKKNNFYNTKLSNMEIDISCNSLIYLPTKKLYFDKTLLLIKKFNKFSVFNKWRLKI